MARCTNCNKVLPFNKVAFLSKRKKVVECQTCHTVLEADEKQLGIIGGISGGVGALLGFLTMYSIVSNVRLAMLFLFVGLIMALVGAIIQNQIIKLRPKDLNGLREKL
jgi:hypothetical protein